MPLGYSQPQSSQKPFAVSCLVAITHTFRHIFWPQVATTNHKFPMVTADTRNCPETATKLPGGGHETCPLAVMRSARHESVCLAASRG